MQVLKTPSERFLNLPDYPFAPNYVQVAHNLDMHYVDEGSSDNEVVLMLHGEPSWSYLYRHIIPPIVAAGHRAIAPDLIGFGKSDKPASIEDYTYQTHLDWLTTFIEKLDLRNITLLCQDWGGLLGLRIAAAQPDRFKRIVAANTFLPTGDQAFPDAFKQWREYVLNVPVFNIGRAVDRGCVKNFSAEEIAAYDAPFPDESYKAGARVFPALVPTQPDNPASQPNREAWQKLMQWNKPFLTAFSDSDPITRGGDRVFQKIVPGCKNQAHTTIVGAGHFLQEDKGEELAKIVVNFMEMT